MEPEYSLPCSQKPAAGPYPEPHESSSYTFPPYFSKHHSYIILFYLRLVLLSGPSIQPEFSVNFSSMPR
jgi:hypothetical protein